MYCGPLVESELVAALKELDTSKALVRSAQAELCRALSELACNRHSPECLNTFMSVNRSLAEATERYRQAAKAFSMVCRRKPLVAAVA
jgi:hypothetical protein